MSTQDRLRIAGRNASVTLLTKGLLAQFSKLADSSVAVKHIESVASAIRNSWVDSATERRASRGWERGRSILRGSQAVSHGLFIVESVSRNTSHAVEHATFAEFARLTEKAMRSSWLYHLLTAEPEPEVIVIDLRDTVSVGPIIEVIESSVRLIVPASHRSTVVNVAETVHQSVVDSPIRAVSIVLGVATLTNMITTLAVGEPTQGGVIVRIVLIGMAALGTRVSLSWDELVERRPVRLLIAILEPPEPPEDRDDV